MEADESKGSDEGSDGSRESWPAELAEEEVVYRGELFVRRENKRLGWRRAVGLLTAGGTTPTSSHAAEGAKLTVVDKATVLHEFPVHSNNVDVEEKKGPLGPVHRIVLGGGFDIGFFGEGSEKNRNRWVAELLLAGADSTSPRLVAKSLTFEKNDLFVSSVEALTRSFIGRQRRHQRNRTDGRTTSGEGEDKVEEEDEIRIVKDGLAACLSAYFEDDDDLIARGAVARCVAAACESMPSATAPLAAYICLVCVEYDGCVKPLAGLGRAASAHIMKHPKAAKALAKVACDTSRDSHVREDAAEILSKAPAVLFDYSSSRVFRALAFKFPDDVELRFERDEDTLAGLVAALGATSLVKGLQPDDEDSTLDDDDDEDLLKAARLFPTVSPPLRSVHVFERTFLSGGSSGLGLELAPGTRRAQGAVAPTAHRTNTSTRHRDVKEGDELIAVNGRRLEYRVLCDSPAAVPQFVRPAMLAACDVVRDAPWPKRLTFARVDAMENRIAAKKLRPSRRVPASFLLDIVQGDSHHLADIKCALLASCPPYRSSKALRFAVDSFKGEADFDFLAPLAAYAAILQTFSLERDREGDEERRVEENDCVEDKQTLSYALKMLDISMPSLKSSLPLPPPPRAKEEASQPPLEDSDDTTKARASPAWWINPDASFVELDCEINSGDRLGCTVVVRGKEAGQGAICLVESIDAEGPAMLAGVRVGDIVIAVNDRQPPTTATSPGALLEFFRGLPFPLTLRLLRHQQPVQCVDEAEVEEKEFTVDDNDDYGDELDHSRIISLCASRLLYSSNAAVVIAAARAIGAAASSPFKRARNIACSRVMDVHTATAVAMIPGMVQRLSSWSPDLNAEEQPIPQGLSREEAAALLPLAEATVSDAVSLAEGAPKILVPIRRAAPSSAPDATAPSQAAPKRRRQRPGTDDEKDDDIVPGSALARLLEMATSSPEPPTADETAVDDETRCAALGALTSLCRRSKSRGGDSAAKMLAAACVVDPSGTKGLALLLGGSRGGRVAGAAARFVRALVDTRAAAAALAKDSDALLRVSWLARRDPTSNSHVRMTGTTVAWRAFADSKRLPVIGDCEVETVDDPMTAFTALEIIAFLCDACVTNDIKVSKVAIEVAATILEDEGACVGEAWRAVRALAAAASGQMTWRVLDDGGGLRALSSTVINSRNDTLLREVALAAICECVLRFGSAGAGAVAKVRGIEALVVAVDSFWTSKACEVLLVATSRSATAKSELAACSDSLIARACVVGQEAFLKCCAKSAWVSGSRIGSTCARAVPEMLAEACADPLRVAWAAPLSRAAAAAANESEDVQGDGGIQEFWNAIRERHNDALWPLLSADSPSLAKEAAAAVLEGVATEKQLSTESDAAAKAIKSLLQTFDSSRASRRAVTALYDAKKVCGASPDLRRAVAKALASRDVECRASAVALCGDSNLAMRAAADKGPSEASQSERAAALAMAMDDECASLAAPLALLACRQTRSVHGEDAKALGELREVLATENRPGAKACALAVLARDHGDQIEDDKALGDAVVAALESERDEDIFKSIEIEASSRLAAGLLLSQNLTPASTSKLSQAVASAVAPERELSDAALASLCEALFSFDEESSDSVIEALCVRLEREESQSRIDVEAAALASLLTDARTPPSASLLSRVAEIAWTKRAAAPLWALRRSVLRLGRQIDVSWDAFAEGEGGDVERALSIRRNLFTIPDFLMPETPADEEPDGNDADEDDDGDVLTSLDRASIGESENGEEKPRSERLSVGDDDDSMEWISREDETSEQHSVRGFDDGHDEGMARNGSEGERSGASGVFHQGEENDEFLQDTDLQAALELSAHEARRSRVAEDDEDDAELLAALELSAIQAEQERKRRQDEEQEEASSQRGAEDLDGDEEKEEKATDEKLEDSSDGADDDLGPSAKEEDSVSPPPAEDVPMAESRRPEAHVDITEVLPSDERSVPPPAYDDIVSSNENMHRAEVGDVPPGEVGAPRDKPRTSAEIRLF